ncbi:hypothetical protein [Amycolatopsis lexingtonensis]|uniref:hypothetical protein n=1 Tax=Amycolatopsis lexingtonensis TaxID=218822 RepID=UPI003F708EEC
MNTHGPALPGEPTYREVVATGAWLARHGARTRVPSRLVAVFRAFFARVPLGRRPLPPGAYGLPFEVAWGARGRA